MERLGDAGSGFRSLTEAIDTTTPAGRMMMQMAGAFAEFERSMLKERTKAGLDAAREEGRIGGRRPSYRRSSKLRFERLSNEDDCVGAREEDWRGRDTIWLAPDSGTFRFAKLLLNAGCSWNPVREYEFEGDAGFRSVGPMSAEMKFFLQGSVFGSSIPTRMSRRRWPGRVTAQREP